MSEKTERSAEAADDLEAQAQELPSAPLEVPVGDIPLPPKELREQLDNSDAGDAETDQELEVAELDFFGDELPSWTRQLKYKFRWKGEAVTAITLRQLTVAQVGQIFTEGRKRRQPPDLYDFYAAMAGLPAAVLRALPAEDGDPIISKGWDFLPPSARPAPD